MSDKVKRVASVLMALTLVTAVGCGEDRSSSDANVVYYDESNEYTQEVEGYENDKGDVVAEDRIIENIVSTPISKGESKDLGTATVEFTEVYSAGIIAASDQGAEYNYNREVIVLECNLKNNSGEPVNFSSYDFVVKGLDGDETELYTGAEAMLCAQEKLPELESFNSEVAPGETLPGYAAFAVYSDWETLTIYYNPINDDNNEAIAFDITRDMVQNLG